MHAMIGTPYFISAARYKLKKFMKLATDRPKKGKKKLN